jgi:hypothetical protein
MPVVRLHPLEVGREGGREGGREERGGGRWREGGWEREGERDTCICH